MKIFLPFVLALVFLTFISTSVFAEKPSDFSSIPEKNGDYPDPDNPRMRVRVFVHEPKTNVSSLAVCSDASSSAIVNTTGWHLPKNVSYRINTKSIPGSVGTAIMTGKIAPNAYSTWQNAVNSNVLFTQGANTAVSRQALDYQNVIAWGNTSQSALAVTYTRYYTSSGEVADVDTIFNKRYSWAWTDPSINACSLNSNAYDVQNILTHELGHWMGLDDHYDAAYVDNTMYGYGSTNEIKKDTLTTGDKANLPTLYP